MEAHLADDLAVGGFGVRAVSGFAVGTLESVGFIDLIVPLIGHRWTPLG
jgi:hypothetical protein